MTTKCRHLTKCKDCRARVVQLIFVANPHEKVWTFKFFIVASLVTLTIFLEIAYLLSWCFGQCLP